MRYYAYAVQLRLETITCESQDVITCSSDRQCRNLHTPVPRRSQTKKGTQKLTPLSRKDPDTNRHMQKPTSPFHEGPTHRYSEQKATPVLVRKQTQKGKFIPLFQKRPTLRTRQIYENQQPCSRKYSDTQNTYKNLYPPFQQGPSRIITEF